LATNLIGGLLGSSPLASMFSFQCSAGFEGAQTFMHFSIDRFSAQQAHPVGRFAAAGAQRWAVNIHDES